MNLRRPASVVAAVLGLSLLAACGGAVEEPMDEGADSTPGTSVESPMPSASSEPTMQDGEASAGALVDWVDYEADPAAYAASDVVLFFHADWCPDCRATEESLVTEGVPDGLTVVKVDFDDSTELRRRYGVTVQHTFVLVEPTGDAGLRWTGTFTGADIAEQLT